MAQLSERDYAEMKSYSLDQLNNCLKELEEGRTRFTSTIDLLKGEELETAHSCISEIDNWIAAYKDEITLRLSINTPPIKPYCIGCDEGVLNQMGHFGGCLPDPSVFNIEDM